MMKVLNAELIVGAVKPEQFPKSELPEFAFSGRSNVGKSSLLNTLVLRKNIAHVSSKPGKTRQINFYNIENKYIFADMPGFGYATVSKEERQQWLTLNTTYLTKRENLVLVFLLVDSRIEPQRNDLAQIEILENAQRKYVVVFTKTDKVSNEALNNRIKQFEYLLQYCNNFVDLIPFSAVTKRGREELLAVIRRFAEQWTQIKRKAD
jgi:GTP-binding protein